MNVSRAATARRTDPRWRARCARTAIASVPSRAVHAASKERAFPRREEESGWHRDVEAGAIVGLLVGAELRVPLGLDPDERVLGARARRPHDPARATSRRRGRVARGSRSRALRRRAGVPAAPTCFSWCTAPAKSGFLFFEPRDHAKSVYMHRGELVFAASNQRIDRLGDSLVRSGVITLEQLRDAERGFRRGERFGKTLVERGLLSPRELWTGVQATGRGDRALALLVSRGSRATSGTARCSPTTWCASHLSTQRLVEEGMRWREELRRFVAALSDPRVRIESVAARRDSTSGIERLLVDALAEESAFVPLCRRVGLDEPTAARMLQLLHRAGALRIRRAPEDPDLTQRVRCQDPPKRVRTLVEESVQLLARAGGADRRSRRRSGSARAPRKGNRGSCDAVPAPALWRLAGRGSPVGCRWLDRAGAGPARRTRPRDPDRARRAGRLPRIRAEESSGRRRCRRGVARHRSVAR